MRRFFNFLVLAAIGIPVACTTDPEPFLSDQSYMPLKKGVYQIYDVDSTWYSAGGQQEIHYELMTEVVDSFLNVENKYTYVIYRYKRDTPADDWMYVDTWSARLSEIRAVVAEGTTDFVKFVLPASEGVRWDGNAFNSMGEDEYELVSTRKPASVNDIDFSDCIEVSQNDDNDMIVRTDIRKEVYARDAGLILKEVRILNYCTAGCTEFGEIESGVVYSQAIKSYGVN